MKKILFVLALGAAPYMQADIFSSVPAESILDKGIRVDIKAHQETVTTGGLYMFLNYCLAKSGVHEAAQKKIENRVSNKWARIAAVHVARAGIDGTTMAVSGLLANREGVYTVKTAGKRAGATATVNLVLSGAEELAQKNSMTKSAVESEIYQSVVRPVVQFFGTNFALNLFNSFGGKGGTPNPNS